MNNGSDGDGWIYVHGRRPLRRVTTSIHRSVVVDEAVCRAARDQVIRAVTQASIEAREFLAVLFRKLSRTVCRSSGWRIIALGLGSPTALSMPLIRSFCYQLAVCLIVREIFGVEHVDIFDPIMDANDDEICRSLLDEYRPDIPGLRSLCNPLRQSEWNYNTESDRASAPGIVLWMPHCEVELYKTVLLGLEAGRDPLASAKALSGMQPQSTSIHCDLSNVIVIGNSLTSYSGENKLPGHIVERIVETALPDFPPFHQAFSDSYITVFRTM